MTVVDLARPIAASAVATTRANADRATTIGGKNGKGVRRGGERLSNSPRCFAHTRPLYIAPLRFVRDYLWRRLIHFEPGADFLDLRSLLFELRNHGLHFAF